MFGQYSRTAVCGLLSDVYKKRETVGHALRVKQKFGEIIKSPNTMLKFIYTKWLWTANYEWPYWVLFVYVNIILTNIYIEFHWHYWNVLNFICLLLY